MDVTLEDLLTMEPRLVALAGTAAPEALQCSLADTVVSWAVTTRISPPHLPALHGGELILVPARVADVLGDAFADLLREAQLLRASAVVAPVAAHDAARLGGVSASLPILVWQGQITADIETVINRELTECRGNLYRVGTELERRIADVAVTSAGIEVLARVASEATGLPIRVYDAAQRLLASKPEVAAHDEEACGLAQPEVLQRLSSGATLILGPLADRQRVMARFLAPRIAMAAEAALRRDDVARPRGHRRVEVTETLLSGRRQTASDQRAAALALGLDPDALFFVAITQGGSEPALARALTPLGSVYPAGGTNGRRTALVESSNRVAGSRAERISEVKRRWEKDHANDGATLAISAPAVGVASVPGAAREASFVASFQEQARFPRRAASFESIDDIGALRLLYQLRDSNELRQFVTQALGSLENQDQRGTLRDTLRAFLESGGSQVDASTRLGIHRNTLAYRLRRIGELVGRDVGDPASWLTLHLALSASDLLDVCGDDS